MRLCHSCACVSSRELDDKKSLRRNKRKKSSNRLYCDAERLLESKMTSSASTIDRLIEILAKKRNWDELRHFLSTEEGFRSEQV